MSKIHDPNVDAMFRNGAQQSQAMAVSQPFNDVQLLSLMASTLLGNGCEPGAAVDLALRTLAEVAVQFHKFPQYIAEAKQRQEMMDTTPTQ